MKENKKLYDPTHAEYFNGLKKGLIHIAKDVVQEVYYHQIEIVKQQQEDTKKYIKKMGIIENVSFANIISKPYPEFVRRNGLAFGFKEIRYPGQVSKEQFEAKIIDRAQNRIYEYVGASEHPLGYRFAFSVKFPIVRDKKGNNMSIDINKKDLENKLEENGLNPSSVRKTLSKYHKNFQELETIYKVFFTYELSKEKIDWIRTLPNETAKETIKDGFRKGIGETLEKAINCVIDLKMEKYPD